MWTTVFGTYHRWLDGWLEAAWASNPDRVLVVSDRQLRLDGDVIVAQPSGRFGEAFMRNVACENGSGWLWQIDVDDRIMPYALEELRGRDCDIMQVGYVSSQGHVRMPTVTSNGEYLANRHNEWMSGSPFTKQIWVAAGGFPDVAWSDWGFWRRCARVGARVESASRPCYRYREEPQDSVTGLYQDPLHVEEALAC